MKAFFNTLSIFAISCLLFEFTQAQEASALEISSPDAGKNQIYANQQTGSWSFGLGGGASFSSNNNESALFRGKNLSTKMFARYTFGSLGLSASTGILPGGISNHSLNQFIKERGLPQEELNITKSNSLNGFLIAGPSFRFGRKIYFNAELQGGLFFNNPGIVQITQQGNTKPLYQFSNGDKELSPGFSASISVNYPVSHSTHFFINADYLHSNSSVRLLDPKGGFDQPTLINRNLQLMVFGAGIVKSFGSNSKTKRQGKSTSTSGNCGTVTFTNTKPDGSIEQFIFACPDDAAQYSQRLNAIPATTKQSQGVTFGEKVSANTIQDSGRRTNTDQHWGDPHENLNGKHLSSQERKGWDGSVKGSSIADKTVGDSTGGKIKTHTWGDPHENLNGRLASSQERKGWDGSVKGSSIADRTMGDSTGGKIKIQHWGDPHENLNGKHASSQERKGWDGSVKGSYKTEVENNDQHNLPGQDFNTTRSNRERGQFLANPDNNNNLSDTGSTTAIATAQDFNTTRSNRERGQFLANPNNNNNLSDTGTTTAITTAQDFNTTRSNRERGQFLANPNNNNLSDTGSTTAITTAQDFNTTRSNRERGQFLANPDNNHSIMEKDIADNALTESDLDGDGIPELSILSVNGAVADINLLIKGNKRAIEISPSSKGIQEAGIKRSAEAAAHWGDPHENVNGKHVRKSNTRDNGNLTTSPISSKIIHSPNGNMLVLSANAGDYPERLRKMPPTEPIKGAEIWMESKDGTLYKRITDDNGSFDLTGIPTGQTLSISMNMAIDGKEDIIIQFPTTHPSGTSVASVLKTRHETAKNSISNVR